VLKRITSVSANGIGSIGKIARMLLIITILSYIYSPAQDNGYWTNALSGKTKIFTISFVDDFDGLAKSGEGDVLTTTDGGRTWDANKDFTFVNEKLSAQILWKADIYCSVMRTTDGGNTWFPYDDGKQEHFCGVYLKDANTGYKVANDFLNKVTNEIIACYEKNKLDSLVDHPQQCTEYYSNADEGWALGWCVKNLFK
jgi:hypothetical protein